MNANGPHPKQARADGDDELLPLAAVCEILRRQNGRPLHPSTPARWARRGLAGERLAVVQVGRAVLTTRRWLRQFGAAVARRRGLEAGPQELEA
jgi:hypothetical protein